ncbi:MAG: hypothetical protein HOQ24_05265 [Mycobacteriaceae bacterium]|nr:hypothetical protein [Mycobacteriaceae bacterium]
MRSFRVATTVLGAILAIPAFAGITATAAPAPPVVGGCYGGHLTTTNVPGSGSGGMDVNVTGGLISCSSPQLRRAHGGMLNVTYPFNVVTGSSSGTGAGGNPANGTVAWSNGTVSVITGNWVTSPVGQNAVSSFGIVRGPGAGHRFVIGTRQIANAGSVGGGSGGAGSVAVTSALFVW